MLTRFYRIIPCFVISFLIICPRNSFAWHDYENGYGDWYYHGSGRDHAYSYEVDEHGSPGYADYGVMTPDYIDATAYFNGSAAPAIVPAPAPQTNPVSIATISQPDPDVFTVNIPNNHGGYTSILIKRSGNGFVGPQGEFYSTFPKVSELQTIYGK